MPFGKVFLNYKLYRVLDRIFRFVLIKHVSLGYGMLELSIFLLLIVLMQTLNIVLSPNNGHPSTTFIDFKKRRVDLV